MNKTRLEAFSDGVFAIVITLLILEIKVPDVPASKLTHALIGIIPKILSFILSFVIIGSYWVAHHTMMEFLEKVDRSVLWLNLLTLLIVAFIPFPTALLGEYPYQKTPVILYACVLGLTNFFGVIFWSYVSFKHRFISSAVSASFIKFVKIAHGLPIICYLIAIVLAYLNMTFSYVIFAVVPLFFIIPNPLINKWITSAYHSKKINNYK